MCFAFCQCLPLSVYAFGCESARECVQCELSVCLGVSIYSVSCLCARACVVFCVVCFSICVPVRVLACPFDCAVCFRCSCVRIRVILF